MKMGRVEYLTIFNYGGSLMICSRHRSLAAAKRAACACEDRGGNKHEIVKQSKVIGWRK